MAARRESARQSALRYELVEAGGGGEVADSSGDFDWASYRRVKIGDSSNQVVRAPDVSWMSPAQVAATSEDDMDERYLNICPALVVEIISAKQRVIAQQRRMVRWMEYGRATGLADRSATQHRLDLSRRRRTTRGTGPPRNLVRRRRVAGLHAGLREDLALNSNRRSRPVPCAHDHEQRPDEVRRPPILQLARTPRPPAHRLRPRPQPHRHHGPNRLRLRLAGRAPLLHLLRLPLRPSDGHARRRTHQKPAHRHRVTLASFYHPLRIAEEVALLDILSGGRVNWGAGRGFDRTEFRAFGVGV